MSPLIRGAIASAVSSASTLLIALPVVDVEHFSPWTAHGALHMLEIIVAVVVLGEARFWKAWADAILGEKGP